LRRRDTNLRKLASSLSNQSSAVIWTLEEFLNSKNILQTLIGGMSTCRKFVSQATLIERPAKVLRAARYNGEMIMAGKGHLRITILNRCPALLLKLCLGPFA